MKKLLLLSVLTLSITALAGCGTDKNASKKDNRFADAGFFSNDIEIVTDQETGCKYASKGATGGITPLLKTDGTPDCGK